jgi:hypothetical protein
MPLPLELAAFSYLLDAQSSAGCLCLLMVQAGKMPLTETILDEPVLADGPGNGKSSLTAPAFQEMHLIFATVTSIHDLASGALLTCKSGKLISQFKTRVQKKLNLAFIIIGRLRVVLYATAHSHAF